jgi:hypothetical protein
MQCWSPVIEGSCKLPTWLLVLVLVLSCPQTLLQQLHQQHVQLQQLLLSLTLRPQYRALILLLGLEGSCHQAVHLLGWLMLLLQQQ